MVFHSEKELEQFAEPFLKKRLLKYSWQVPIHNRVIDFAAVDSNGNLIGIEFKLAKWKKALSQARLNSNSFDFLYVCVPGGQYLNALIDDAKKLGVGVIAVDENNCSLKIELEAEKITIQWKTNLENVRKHIFERGLNGI